MTYDVECAKCGLLKSPHLFAPSMLRRTRPVCAKCCAAASNAKFGAQKKTVKKNAAALKALEKQRAQQKETLENLRRAEVAEQVRRRSERLGRQ